VANEPKWHPAIRHLLKPASACRSSGFRFRCKSTCDVKRHRPLTGETTIPFSFIRRRCDRRVLREVTPRAWTRGHNWSADVSGGTLKDRRSMMAASTVNRCTLVLLWGWASPTPVLRTRFICNFNWSISRSTRFSSERLRLSSPIRRCSTVNDLKAAITLHSAFSRIYATSRNLGIARLSVDSSVITNYANA